MHPFPLVGALNMLSALLFIALGVWVLLARRRNSGNVAFAVYAMSFAGSSVLVNLAAHTHWFEERNVGPTVEGLWVVAASAVLWLAIRLPTRVSRRDGAALAAAGAIGAGLLVLRVSPWDLYTAALWTAALVMAFRWRSYANDDERGAAALMSAGIALYMSTQRGFNLGTVALGTREWDLWLGAQMPMPFLVAAAWLVNAARGGGRVAVLAAWLVLGAMLLGLVERLLYPAAPDLYGHAVVRFVGFAILAYAIVRHQVLGAAGKFRWAFSKSTVAAIFIAVFFVASELAQEFFGETLGSAYVGILAAGALVFALAPLSRVADRLAERVVPSAVPQAPGTAAQEDAYRASVRLAMRGGISRREEFELARIAEAHGLSPTQALALRDEVEREGGVTGGEEE